MRRCWEPFLCVNKEISPGCFFPGLVVPGAVGSRWGGLGHKQAKLKSRFHVFLKVSLFFFLALLFGQHMQQTLLFKWVWWMKENSLCFAGKW